MGNIKIADWIAISVRELHKTDKFKKRFGSQTLGGFVSECLSFFLSKHDECFSCQYHKDMVAGLELGRQSIARRGRSESKGEFVQCNDEILKKCRAFAKNYGRPIRDIVEQAILEHITRSSKCFDCQFYKEMNDKQREEQSA